MIISSGTPEHHLQWFCHHAQVEHLLDIIVIAIMTLFISKRDENLLEGAMTLLDVALPGELRSEVSIQIIKLSPSRQSPMMIEVVERGGKTVQLDTPESSVKSGQGGGREKKRPSSPLSRLQSASPKRVKSEGGREAGSGSSTSKSTTHPQYLLLQLTQALMPFEEGKVLHPKQLYDHHYHQSTTIAIRHHHLVIFSRRLTAM